MSDIIIYSAKKIITMNPRRPYTSHVAIRGGKILGAGSLEELAGWGEYNLDERFSDKTMMPGMIEGHSHATEGSVWKDCYVGYYDRRGPDGKIHPGLRNIDEVVDYLKRVDEELGDSDEPIRAWGFDPIYFSGRGLAKENLDKVSEKRPILVVHASFHIINVNSFVLNKANVGRHTNVTGVMKDSGGDVTGEMQGLAARFMVFSAMGISRDSETTEPEALWRFARSAQLSGVTTATDLANTLSDEVFDRMIKVVDRDDYPLRIVPAFLGNSCTAKEGVLKVKELTKQSTDKLRIGVVKLVVDGSIQGFTARLKDPGYYNGKSNGLWYLDPDELPGILDEYNQAGLQVHLHTNGDQATEIAIDAIDNALVKTPRLNARFTLQHCQMAHEVHYKRMARLGICVNLFSNHIFYWGDEHYTQTMGPERAERMNAAGTAKRLGVPFSIHSDAPITPLSPLFTAWCAVNRTTASGRVLGNSERLSVKDALHAVTLGAAYTLKLDGEIGSIESGKRADFAILEEDPLVVEPARLKDVPVWGTIIGGRVFANEDVC